MPILLIVFRFCITCLRRGARHMQVLIELTTTINILVLKQWYRQVSDIQHLMTLE